MFQTSMYRVFVFGNFKLIMGVLREIGCRANQAADGEKQTFRVDNPVQMTVGKVKEEVQLYGNVVYESIVYENRLVFCSCCRTSC